MSVTPGGDDARRIPVMAFVACGIALALVGWAGVFLWTEGRGSRPDPGDRRRTVPVGAMTTQAETSQQTPAVSEARAIAPAGREPAAETAAVPPSPGEAGDKQPEAATTRKPEPPLVKCTLERASWPADGTEQAKAIQILLRDLGFYSGTTYGTLGPTTRAAIRKFQVAEGEADTGEPSEMLFQSLRKKCAP